MESLVETLHETLSPIISRLLHAGRHCRRYVPVVRLAKPPPMASQWVYPFSVRREAVCSGSQAGKI